MPITQVTPARFDMSTPNSDTPSSEFTTRSSPSAMSLSDFEQIVKDTGVVAMSNKAFEQAVMRKKMLTIVDEVFHVVDSDPDI